MEMRKQATSQNRLQWSRIQNLDNGPSGCGKQDLATDMCHQVNEIVNMHACMHTSESFIQNFSHTYVAYKPELMPHNGPGY